MRVPALLVGVAATCILFIVGAIVVFLQMVGNEEGPQP